MIGFVRSFRSIVVLVYWPKSASVRLNQTIKAIDLACELYERREILGHFVQVGGTAETNLTSIYKSYLLT
jgi:hypothetical protein